VDLTNCVSQQVAVHYINEKHLFVDTEVKISNPLMMSYEQLMNSMVDLCTHGHIQEENCNYDLG
jgi:hypothetical protein